MTIVGIAASIEPASAAAQQPYSVLAPDALSSFSLRGAPSEYLQVTNVQTQQFTTAMSLRTPEWHTENPWDVRAVAYPAREVAKGDLMLATFWMRSRQSQDGRGYARFVIERASDPYTKSAEWFFSAATEWERIEIPFTMAETYQAWEYTIQFWVAVDPQVVEIAGLSVVDYGSQAQIGDLPLLVYPYPGSNADAPWRAEARQRIEKLRKAPLTVSVADSAGLPVAGVPVHVKMKRHSFRFGAAVDAGLINSTSPDAQRYRETIASLFNAAVFENDLKWPQWENDHSGVHAALEWLASVGIRDVRGHNLVWQGWQYLPLDLQQQERSTLALQNRIVGHISDEVTSLAGYLTDWDVVNEPMGNDVLQQILGGDAMSAWFSAARKSDARARLFVNETSILSSAGADILQQDGLFGLIADLERRTAPLDAIGLQAHFNTNLTSPGRLWEILERFATFQKPVVITEFDISNADEITQANYTRDFLTLIFSHPAVEGLFLWGFWEGRDWEPDAALFRRDWSLKPNGAAWRDLLYHEWWTDVSGETDAAGRFQVVGFLGDFDIEVGSGGAQRIYPATIRAGANNLDLSLAPQE